MIKCYIPLHVTEICNKILPQVEANNIHWTFYVLKILVSLFKESTSKSCHIF